MLAGCQSAPDPAPVQPTPAPNPPAAPVTLPAATAPALPAPTTTPSVVLQSLPVSPSTAQNSEPSLTAASVQQKATAQLVNNRLDVAAFSQRLCSDIETQSDPSQNSDNLAIIETMVKANSDAMNQVGPRRDLVVFAGVLDDCKNALLGKMNGVPYENWTMSLRMARASASSLNQPPADLGSSTRALTDIATRH